MLAKSPLQVCRLAARPDSLRFSTIFIANTMTDSKESLIEYPSDFPIKVMGPKVDHFVHTLTQIAESFDPHFDARTVELRESSTGKYLGVTLTVRATSREQLDALYQTLSTHPMVKVVL
jgi:putative lipoic acid-binding regulatory protein